MITRRKAREEIEAYMAQKGPYTHNLISMTLREVAKRFGKEEANKIIRQFSLYEKYRIAESVIGPVHRKYLGPKDNDLDKSLRKLGQ